MSKVTSFILGGLIGAGVALMFAPNAGEKNRALVAEKANALAGEAKDFGAGLPGSAQDLINAAYEKGNALLKDATAKGSSVVGGATSRVKEVSGQPAPAEDADELREKIEAARRRIAAQVMENAESSKALTADAILEATDAVTEEAPAAAEEAAETAEAAAAEAVEQAPAAAEEAAE